MCKCVYIEVRMCVFLCDSFQHTGGIYPHIKGGLSK